MRKEELAVNKQNLFTGTASVELGYKGYTISMKGSPVHCSVDIIPWKGASPYSPGIKSIFHEGGPGDSFLYFDPVLDMEPKDIPEMQEALKELKDLWDDVTGSWDMLKAFLTNGPKIDQR